MQVYIQTFEVLDDPWNNLVYIYEIETSILSFCRESKTE